MNKNKSMNFLFKTMPENEANSRNVEPKEIRKKRTKSNNNSISSKILSKNNSIKNKLKIGKKGNSAKEDIHKEVKNMFELEIMKHLQQTDKMEKGNKSSFMDLNLGKSDKTSIL